MTIEPLTIEFYEAVLAAHEECCRHWRSLTKAADDAQKALNDARDVYCKSCSDVRDLQIRWGRQQPLSGVERRWLNKLAENPIFTGGWRHREQTKTEARMRAFGFANSERNYLRVTALGKAKLAEPVVKKGRKR